MKLSTDDLFAPAPTAPMDIAKLFEGTRLPRLWGNGVTDDTEAFQAVIDGKPFDTGKYGVRIVHDGVVYLAPPEFQITWPQEKP